MTSGPNWTSSVSELAAWVRDAHPEVLAVGIGGSHASGDNDSQSDIDLFIYTNELALTTVTGFFLRLLRESGIGSLQGPRLVDGFGLELRGLANGESEFGLYFASASTLGDSYGRTKTKVLFDPTGQFRTALDSIAASYAVNGPLGRRPDAALLDLLFSAKKVRKYLLRSEYSACHHAIAILRLVTLALRRAARCGEPYDLFLADKHLDEDSRRFCQTTIPTSDPQSLSTALIELVSDGMESAARLVGPLPLDIHQQLENIIRVQERAS